MSYAAYCRLNCHVTESNMTVIRKIWRRMDKAQRHARQFRKVRHKYYRAILKEHRAAQRLFRSFRF